jgi:hypothetical protein
MNIMFIITIITVSSLIVSVQVRVQLGLPNHAWQDKHAVIAKTVDDLGDQFRPAMRSGWLAYIKNAYGAAAPAATSRKDQGTLIVQDDDC